MATVVNDRDVLLLAASPRLLWAGVRGVALTADTTSFKVSGGSPTPSTINLSATLNGVNGTVSWGVVFGSANLTVLGATATLSYPNMFSDVITVRASVTDGGAVWQSSITITRVADGSTGDAGAAGSTGAAGDKARIAYTLIDGFSLSGSPSSTTVSGDTFPTTGTWGETRAWTSSPYTASVGQAVFQSTGTYNPVTNQTTWVVPYLSNLKVGTLSAIVTNTGTLVIDSTGYLRGGQTAYNTGDGFWQGYDAGVYKMSIGTADNSLTYDGDKLVIDVFGGFVQFGKTGVSASVLQTNRDTSTVLPAVSIFDTSTSLSEALYVTNSSSFTGSTMVGLRATKGEAIRAITDQSTQYSGVFQNLGSGKALAIAGTTYSGYSGSGNGVMNIVDGYLPFTGIHISMINKGSTYTVGDIVRSVEVLTKKDISNTLLRVEVVNSAKNKAVFGVINSVSEYENYLDFDLTTWYNYQELYTGLHINSVGEGCINVCGINGDIEAGDLITSSNMTGKGMKQSDDIVRSYTVAKSTEDVKFDFPEQVKMIACTYMCG